MSAMPPLSILMKPASSLCNLRCGYCFYHDVVEHRSVKSYGIMREELLETIVRKALAQTEGFVSFAFQGGEPTLAGLEFFKRFSALVKQYNTQNVIVHNAIQTNGIVINDEWAAYFREQNFLVGLSLDGHRGINDKYRTAPDGSGSFEAIQRTAKLFDKHDVQYNVLCVVTADTAKNIRDIYRFFKERDYKYLQFIPCLDPMEEERGLRAHSLTPELYREFLCELFDCWYKNFKQGNYISVRQFDNWIHMLNGRPPESCGMSGRCGCYFVIESDGSVYPCDFYVTDKWNLGSIENRSFSYLMKQQTARDFVEESLLAEKKCRQCKHFRICRGGCKRDRLDGLEDNYFCEAYYDFFDYAYERLEEIAGMVRGG